VRKPSECRGGPPGRGRCPDPGLHRRAGDVPLEIAAGAGDVRHAEFAEESAPLAANQGLYNGFLAAALIWGLIATDPTGFQFKLYALACVIVARLYGAATANKRILLVQVLPAALALVAVLLAR
jgi:putative membrane protein